MGVNPYHACKTVGSIVKAVEEGSEPRLNGE